MNTNFNIAELFFTAAQKHPERIAIIYINREITFNELAEQVKNTACYFRNKGIEKGDRVLVFVPMSIDLYRIVLALFSIGATAVFVDEWVNKKRMEECCKVARCKAFIGIFKARLLSLFSYELRKIPITLGTKYPGALSGNQQGFKADVTGADTALITFTTGSTGIPKAAKRTHDFLLKQFEALNDKLDPRDSDIDMPVLPVVLLMNLGNGTTSLISDFKANKPEAMKPPEIIAQISRYHVNRMIASPFFVRKLSEYMIRSKICLPGMRKIFTGGAPVFPHEAEIYQQAFPDADIEVVYGSTEAEPISSVKIKELIREKNNLLKAGLKVGTVYKNAEVKIIRITDDVVSVESEEDLDTLPSDSIGEIIVSGAHVLREYINNEEAVRRNKIFIHHTCWHRTGDSGYIDESGMLYLTGRCNTLIEEKGAIIAPFIYENYFQSLPGVSMGTVLKIGSDIICIIELNAKDQIERVSDAIKMLDLKFAEIKFVKKIPRDLRHHSKIGYSLLRKMFE